MVTLSNNELFQYFITATTGQQSFQIDLTSHLTSVKGENTGLADSGRSRSDNENITTVLFTVLPKFPVRFVFDLRNIKGVIFPVFNVLASAVHILKLERYRED